MSDCFTRWLKTYCTIESFLNITQTLNTYKRWVFFDLVIQCVGVWHFSFPETVLAESVVRAFLASVAKSTKILFLTSVALNWVNHLKDKKHCLFRCHLFINISVLSLFFIIYFLICIITFFIHFIILKPADFSINYCKS